jgi:hypothetical protein
VIDCDRCTKTRRNTRKSVFLLTPVRNFKSSGVLYFVSALFYATVKLWGAELCNLTTKVKVTLRHAYAGTAGTRRYSSKRFATSAVEGGGWSAPRQAALPVPIVQEGGWAPASVWTGIVRITYCCPYFLLVLCVLRFTAIRCVTLMFVIWVSLCW